MTKSRTLTIEFEKWEDFKARVKKDLKAGGVSISKKGTLTFRSVADYQKFMTEQKLAILAAIINEEPKSIYQLAQMVERDFANVQRDCVALEAMGFISLNEAGDAKGSKVPKLIFGYTRIVIKMPKFSYSHELGKAA